MTPKEIRKARRSWRYRKWRRRILAEEPLCRPCQKAGFTVVATELDHIVPVSEAAERFWDETNVQPICQRCHGRKSLKESGHEETPEQVEWRKRIEALSA